MKTRASILAVLVLAGATAGAAELPNPKNLEEWGLCDVAASPDRFQGERISVAGKIDSDSLYGASIHDGTCGIGLTFASETLEKKPSVQAFDSFLFTPYFWIRSRGTASGTVAGFIDEGRLSVDAVGTLQVCEPYVAAVAGARANMNGYVPTAAALCIKHYGEEALAKAGARQAQARAAGNTYEAEWWSKIANHITAALPTAAAIKKLEAQVRMPAGSQPLTSYRRTYAIATRKLDGKLHRIVTGVFLTLDIAKALQIKRGTPIYGIPNVFVVPDEDLVPSILDGGCQQVTVSFDLETQKLVTSDAANAWCNGVA